MTTISSGSYKDMTRGSCVTDGLGKQGTATTTTPAIVGKICAHANSIVQGTYSSCGGTTTIGGQKLKSHDPCVPVYTCGTYSVVSYSTNGASHMGSMALVIKGICIVVGKVVAINIICVAIAIVVDTIACDFASIAPHVCCKVLVVVVNACIDNSDDGSAGSGIDVPSFGSIDISIVGATSLGGVVKAVHGGKTGIVWNAFEHKTIVGFSGCNSCVCLENCKCAFNTHALGKLEFIEAINEFEGLGDFCTMKIDVSGEHCIGFELNQDGVGHISGGVYKKTARRGEGPHSSIKDGAFLKKFEVKPFAKGCVQTWLAGSESCHVKPLERGT